MRTWFLLPLLLIALAAGGCGEQNLGGESSMTAAESQQNIESQIKAIEANDKMPPQAKAAAIANLKNRQQFAPEMGKGQDGK